jgi:endogenous inhibitor of DNA gyrase (YacG/DUF329 family)
MKNKTFKKLKCPNCNKFIGDVVEFKAIGRIRFYRNRNKFGYMAFPYWSSILSKQDWDSKRRSKVSGKEFQLLEPICSKCQKPITWELVDKIKKYWLTLNVIDRLQK